MVLFWTLNSIPISIPISVPISIPIIIPISVPFQKLALFWTLISIPINVPIIIPISITIIIPISIPINFPISVHKIIPYNTKNNLQKHVLNSIALYINPGLATGIAP